MQLLLFGFAVEAGTLGAVAFRGLQYGAALLVGVDCPLYACHGVFLSSCGRSGCSGDGALTGAGQPFSSFLTRLVSLADTVVRPSSRRVRVLGLCSSRWRRLAFWRTILPVPVRRNRFDAPLWVLVLGMCPQFCGVSWATVRRRYSVVRPEAWDQWPVPPRGHGSSRRGAVPTPSSCCARPAWPTSRRIRSRRHRCPGVAAAGSPV